MRFTKVKLSIGIYRKLTFTLGLSVKFAVKSWLHRTLTFRETRNRFCYYIIMVTVSIILVQITETEFQNLHTI